MRRRIFFTSIKSCNGLSTVPLVGKAVKRSSDPEVRWKTAEYDETQSMESWLQEKNSKSPSSLTSYSFVFYPFNVTLMNFSAEKRRSLIRDGSTIVAYLSVTLNTSKISALKQSAEIMRKKDSDRVHRLLPLHKTVAFCLKEVSKLAEVGVAWETRDNRRFRMHFQLPHMYLIQLDRGTFAPEARKPNSDILRLVSC